MKFKVVSSDQTTHSSTENPHERITRMVQENPVFLFMKGSPEAPQCGFSAKASKILSSWGVPFESFNVYSDENIRQGIKEFSNWPTIPQLYVNQEFIGGSDIIEQLSQSGELKEVFQGAYPDREFTPPSPPAEVQTISATEAAEKYHDHAVKLLDVRTPEEWNIVHIENSILIDRTLVEEILDTWDRNTPLMLLCHHGMRSYDAARFFTEQGFQQVYNVTGGIDAWSQEVDPSLRRY